jgi:hypothetical protein
VVKGGIVQTQIVGHWQVIEYVDLGVFAVLSHVFKEILLVGDLVMKLEMVETLPQNTVFQSVIVLVPSVGLHPFQV